MPAWPWDDSACQVVQLALQTLVNPVANTTLDSKAAMKNQNKRRSTRRSFHSTVIAITASNTRPMYFSGASVLSESTR